MFFIVTGKAEEEHFRLLLLWTGVYSIMAIIFYYIAAEFTYTERHWTFLFFKPAYVSF